MSRRGIQQQVDALLDATNTIGGYPSSLVCTDEGLVVASAGEVAEDEDTAAFASLFDDVVIRAMRDLKFERVDEVTLLDPGRGRTVIRPLDMEGADNQLFLVVRVPVKKTWRRNTNQLCRQLVEILRPLVSGEVA
ncbi:MAG: hypothetical protein EP330_06005 [Deltaproteobacteria bacterium]|nr:MAG: hypothetical protein EP330_06005 [Deltaproteobacteria bacterium]